MYRHLGWGLWVVLWLGLTCAHAGPTVIFPTGTTSGGTPIPDLTCNAEDGFACLIGELLPDAILPNPELLSGEPAPGTCRGPKHTMVLPDGAGGLRMWGCAEALGNPLEMGGRPGFNQVTDALGTAKTITPAAPDGTLNFVGCTVSGTAPDITVTCHSETSGSGAENTIPLWSSDDTLTDSLLSQSGGNLFQASGHLLFTGATSDIGTTTANRPRFGYFTDGLRIGTDMGSSTVRLSVKTTGTQSGIFINTTTPSSTQGAGMIGGVGATPSAADQRLGFLLFASNPSGNTFRFGGGIQMFTAGAWTDNVAHPAYLSFSTTPSASTTRTERWQIRESGHLWAVADNTYDIGADGATRPRSIYAGTAVHAPTYFVGSTEGATGTCSSVGVVNGIVTVCTP